MTYTPMMKQYLKIKEENKDSIVFFRLGDFYEMFFDDAIIASRELEIALTERASGDEKIPMCGVPYHVKDIYIGKLVEKGYKIAIVEQLEDPEEAKGLVERGVIEVITPGTYIDPELQKEDSNFLLSIISENNKLGLSMIDLSTGKLLFTESLSDDWKLILENEISRVDPKEIIHSIDYDFKKYIDQGITVTEIEKVSNTSEIINKRLDTKLEEFSSKRVMLESLGQLLDYIYSYREENFSHISQVNYYEINDYLEIDSHSIRNLELLRNLYTGNKKGSLFDILDETKTSMGSRKLRSFIERPLLSRDLILERQEIVQVFFDHIHLREKIRHLLESIYDLERIIGKLSYGNANGRDLIALKKSLSVLPEIKELLSSESVLESLFSFDPLNDLFQLIEDSIVEEPPILITEGELIKEEFDEELDDIRSSKIRGQERLIAYEEEEREKLDIRNLKIVFNKKRGYFIDITKANLSKVPDHYKKQQTLTNSDRFITEELEEIESMILGSDYEIVKKEYEVFQNIRKILLEELRRIQDTAEIIAKIDVFSNLGKISYDKNYTRPQINQSGIFDVLNGRHPMVEESIGQENFISNNILTGRGKDNIQIITGPNMSGKSTYLRQNALIILLGQMGSFVPAEQANIGIVDKIFTRIGASDNLYSGESTFMVEMNEMSYILRNATENSLLILDEVGRGTSTYDGLSIAWSILEYISKKLKSKTLFATHYHELTALENILENIVNRKVSIEEVDGEILFLRKIVPGSSERSYGIEVAKLAGIPHEIIFRANHILESIEENNTNSLDINILDKEFIENISFIDEEYENKEKRARFEAERADYIQEIKGLDINNMSPMDALQALNRLIEKAKDLK